MKTPSRVVWAEGMVMTPQHMQQADLYHDRLLATRLEAVTPHAWGVVSLKIDPQSLASGQFLIERFEGVFGDGTAAGFASGETGSPASRPIEPHLPATQPSVDVFIAVPAGRESVRYYGTETTSDQLTRFMVRDREVPDAGEPTSRASVSFADLNVRVLFGDESRSDFEFIKIAEVVRDSTGTLQLNTGYIPPSLAVGASNYLQTQLSQLLATTVAKQRELSQQRRERDASTVEFSAPDVTQYLLLDTINDFLPVLAHLNAEPRTAPLSAYLLLARFAGRLATFVADADPTSLPRFDHGDLRSTFAGLFEVLESRLPTTIQKKHLEIPITQRADSIRVGALTDERTLQPGRFILAVTSEMPEQTIGEQLPKLLKIAAESDITAILQSAMPGVRAELTYRPPAAIPARSGVVYFELLTKDIYWENILRERKIAIYLPPPFDSESVRMRLYVAPGLAV